MITVSDQMKILESVADSIASEASELAKILAHWPLSLESQYVEPTKAEILESVKEALLDEVSIIRSMLTDIRHAEDTRQTRQLAVRDLSQKLRLSTLYGKFLNPG